MRLFTFAPARSLATHTYSVCQTPISILLRLQDLPLEAEALQVVRLEAAGRLAELRAPGWLIFAATEDLPVGLPGLAVTSTPPRQLALAAGEYDYLVMAANTLALPFRPWGYRLRHSLRYFLLLLAGAALLGWLSWHLDGLARQLLTAWPAGALGPRVFQRAASCAGRGGYCWLLAGWLQLSSVYVRPQYRLASYWAAGRNGFLLAGLLYWQLVLLAAVPNWAALSVVVPGPGGWGGWAPVIIGLGTLGACYENIHAKH